MFGGFGAKTSAPTGFTPLGGATTSTTAAIAPFGVSAAAPSAPAYTTGVAFPSFCTSTAAPAAPAFNMGGLSTASSFMRPTAPAPSSTGFAFGQVTTAPGTSTLGSKGLGISTAAPAAPAFNLGGLSTASSFMRPTAPAPTSTGFAFGQVTTAPGATPTSRGLGGVALGTATLGSKGLGTSTAAPAAPAFNLGGTAPGSFGGLTTSTAPVAPFNLTGTSTAAPGFNLGGLSTASSIAPAATVGGLSFLRPTAPAPTSTGFSFSQVTTAPGATPTSRGLGGVALGTSTLGSKGLGTSQSSPGKSGLSKHGKDAVMPNEIIQTVDQFKKYLAEQKKIREELTKVSHRSLEKVTEELGMLKQQVNQVTNSLQRNVGQTRKLKEDVAQEERNLAIAQRTHETPPGLQCENMAPTDYFNRMVADCETRLRLYKEEIETIEGLISSQAHGKLTPKELADVLRRMDDEFIGLAARLYTVHESIRKLKSHYMKRRRALGDARDPFSGVESISRESRLALGKVSAGRKMPPTTHGPSPFEGMNAGLDRALLYTMAGQSAATQAAPPTQPLGGAGMPLGGFSFSNQPAPAAPTFSFPTQSSLFGATTTTAGGLFNKPVGSAAPFFSGTPILQNPPAGKKKR